MISDLDIDLSPSPQISAQVSFDEVVPPGTELVQKWSLLVRIRTSMKRISKSEISLSKLLFRPDSGQIELDIGIHWTQKQQLRMHEQKELIQLDCHFGDHLIKLVKHNVGIFMSFDYLFALIVFYYQNNQILIWDFIIINLLLVIFYNNYSNTICYLLPVK